MLDATPSAPHATWDDCAQSDAFRADLAALDATLFARLDRYGAPRRLNGNLFYDHLAERHGPDALDPKSADKRARLFEIAKRGGTLLEIGVNGGHSLLLAKHANPALKVIGIDICQQLTPKWGRVDLYVPEAMAWLDHRFPGDCRFIRGNSLLEAPRLAVEHPDLRIDILHIDGDKNTYFRDVVNLTPCMTRETLIVLDDSHMRPVRRCIRQLVRAGIAEPHPDYPPETNRAYQHRVMRLT